MIKNEKQLIEQMMRDLEKFMLSASQKIYEKWKQLIYANWYERYPESDYYNRTYEFVSSLTSSNIERIQNGYRVVIYFDISKMSVGLNSAGYFIEHAQRDLLPELIEEGYSVFGHKNLEGSHAYAETLEWLQDRNFFLKELKAEFGDVVTLKIT